MVLLSLVRFGLLLVRLGALNVTAFSWFASITAPEVRVPIRFEVRDSRTVSGKCEIDCTDLKRTARVQQSGHRIRGDNYGTLMNLQVYNSFKQVRQCLKC